MTVEVYSACWRIELEQTIVLSIETRLAARTVGEGRDNAPYITASMGPTNIAHFNAAKNKMSSPPSDLLPLLLLPPFFD